jgi:hypothetical protein
MSVHTGLQKVLQSVLARGADGKEILSLYRQCMRAVRQKPEVATFHLILLTLANTGTLAALRKVTGYSKRD